MTDLATLEASISSLASDISVMSDEATQLFEATTTLKTNVQTDIATAQSLAENAAIEPMIAMASALALLSGIMIANMTPEA